MRRMYSEQELTRIIGEVFDQKLESGALDSSISDAVDAYLVEHPVDITALEGQTIAPAVVNASTSISAPAGTFTSINGESSPSVKPIYCHPYIFYEKGGGAKEEVSGFIFNQQSTAYTLGGFYDYIASVYALVGNDARFPVSGVFKDGETLVNAIFITMSASGLQLYGRDDSEIAHLKLLGDKTAVTESYDIVDGVNKIN